MWIFVNYHGYNIYHDAYKRDLMAQRLAHRTEDQEVPGSSPTQD